MSEEPDVKYDSPEPSIRTSNQRPIRPAKAVPRRQPIPSRGNETPSRGSGVLRRSVEVPLILPERYQMQGVAGRVYETAPFGDAIFTSLIKVVQMSYGTISFYGNNGTNGGQLTTFVDSIFPLLQQKVLEKGKFIASSLGTAANFANWLAGYAISFMILRSLEALLAANGINQALTKIADAGGPYKIRLEQNLQRLASYPVPQGLVDMLDRMCGVFIDTYAGMAWISFVDPTVIANARADMTTSAGWNGLMSDAEAALIAPWNTVSAADFQLIVNVLGTLFGVPTIGNKSVSSTGALIDQWKTQLIVWDDTGGTPGFIMNPTVNATSISGGNIIPLLVRQGRPTEFWEPSLLRPALYGFNTTPNNKTTSSVFQAGFIAGSVATPPGANHYETYDVNGIYQDASFAAAGVLPVGGQTLFANVFTYFPFAASESGIPPIAQAGQSDLWEVFITSQDALVDETILQYTRIFELSN